jgi:hypothetical protein
VHIIDYENDNKKKKKSFNEEYINVVKNHIWIIMFYYFLSIFISLIYN